MSQPLYVPCPHCGTSYTLTPDYLARYGGQTTACSNCGGHFALPPAGAQENIVPPGLPPPQQGPAMLAYAPPAYSMHPPAGVWSDGRVVVARKGASLPYYCVKCGQPAEGRPWRKTFYWHPPILYLTILAGLLVYVIVALCVRDSGSVEYALCGQHRARRRNGMLIGSVLAVAGVAMFFVAGATDAPVWIPFGILTLIGGLVWALVAARTLAPQRIDAQYLWLKGAGEPFLRVLPSAHPQGQPQYGPR